MHKPDEIASQLFGVPFASLDARTRKVAEHIAARKPIARNLAEEGGTQAGLGPRAADAVAKFGGSWTFVGLFVAAMLLWVGLNTFLLLGRGKAFDPYPFILLNLFLSMLAPSRRR